MQRKIFNKTKAISCLLLIVMLSSMLAGCMGCNSSKDIYETMKKGGEISVGTFETTIDMTEEIDGVITEAPAIKITSCSDGMQRLISISIDDQGKVTELNNVLLYGGGTIYLNIGVLNETGINDDSMENKWVSFPSFSFTEEFNEHRSTLQNSIIDAFKEATANVEVSCKKSVYTMQIDNGEQLADVAESFLNIINTNADEIGTTLGSAITAAGIDKSINNLIGTIGAIFSPDNESIPASDFVKQIPEGIRNGIEEAKPGIEEIRKQGENCSMTYEVSCTGGKDKRVYTQDIKLKYVADGSVNSIHISSVFYEDPNMGIFPPEEKDIIPTEGINDFLALLATLNLNIDDIDFGDEPNINDDSSLYIEDSESRYEVTVNGSDVICVRENPLFTEQVVYSTKNEVVSGITMKLQTTERVIYDAFINYYQNEGFVTIEQDDSFFSDRPSGEEIDQGDQELSTFATVTMVASDATIQYWVKTATSIERLVEILSK